jgi:hypothetical protein
MNDEQEQVVGNAEDVKSFFSNAPKPREVTWDGKVATFYFRRITGSERLHINRGQKVTFGSAGTERGKSGNAKTSSNMEMDLGDLETKRQLMVLYSCVTPNNTQLFKNLDAVRALSEAAIAALDKVATEVNEEGVSDLGKA